MVRLTASPRQLFRRRFFHLYKVPQIIALRAVAYEYNELVEFVLRDYRPDDFETLWKIDQQCFAPGIAYSRRELSVYIRRSGSFTVVAERPAGIKASQNSKPETVGFIVAETNRRGVGHIISIDVLPDFRRSGLGSKLLRQAETRLQNQNCTFSVLETAVDNAAALAFYKRHQYSVTKVVPRYYSNGVDAFVLEKELNSQVAANRATG